MNALDTEFHRRLKAKLEQMLSDEMTIICNGALDFEGYKRHCGYIAALNDVIDRAAEIESEMNKGN